MSEALSPELDQFIIDYVEYNKKLLAEHIDNLIVEGYLDE